jgi:TRAP-type mannitol/chloroaromatic compound transport system permease small subunit
VSIKTLLQVSAALERLAVRIGRLAAWAAIFMILVILSDVILRRYFVIGSTKLQELEWHLHGFLFLSCLGFAYARGAHVRIELFREKWSARTKAWMEVAGTLLLLLPFAFAILYFGWDYAAMSYGFSESSPTATGLGGRWIIKGVLVAGFGLLVLPALANLIRTLVWLLTGHEAARQALETELSDTQKTV